MPHPLDREDMESVIRGWPDQFHAGLKAAAREDIGAGTVAGPFDRVLVVGMGGSWMGGALVQEAGLAAVPISVHRGYGLPGGSLGRTLVVASSFSGNTEETLSAYDAARSRSLPLVGIAAGGMLEQRCRADGVPCIRIPADPPSMQPRSATGYTVAILVQLLARLGLAADGAVDTIEGLRARLHAFMETARARGEKLAADLRGVTPVIYASDRFATVARIWKIKMNENAKTPAFWNVFPELNHNEMIGWTTPQGTFRLVFLRDPDDHLRVLKRFDSTQDLLQQEGIAASIVPIEGSTHSAKIFSTLLVGDWTSYTLALALGTDPTPIPMVEELKKRLAA